MTSMWKTVETKFRPLDSFIETLTKYYTITAAYCTSTPNKISCISTFINCSSRKEY